MCDETKISTKKNICNALIKLLQHYDLDKISVKQIIFEAKINRSSFYYHFDNIKEVFHYICKTFVNDYYQSVSPFPDLGNGLSMYDIQLICWERTILFTYTQKETLLILLKPEYVSELLQYIIKYYQEHFHHMNLTYRTENDESKVLAPGLLYDYYIYKCSYDILCSLNYIAFRNFSDDPLELAKVFLESYSLRFVDYHKNPDFQL